MSPFEYFITYIICWWLALFMVLPFKAQPAVVSSAAHYHAAPARTYLKQKVLAATLLAVLFTGMVAFALHNPLVLSWLSGK